MFEGATITSKAKEPKWAMEWPLKKDPPSIHLGY